MHVDARFDATFEYAYSFQNDFAAKHNWSYASAECEPQQTRTCLTKICVNDDSDWSGLANCTCDGDVMTPPKHSPLDRMRRSWKRLDKIKVKKPMNTTVDSSQLVVLDEKELWQVDPYNDGQRKIGGSIMIELASDFELWYDRKALIIPMSNNGVRMCNVSMNDEAGSFLGCQCALFCPANTFEQLDSNSIPLKSHVALDWIHGKYYWTGRRLEIGAVGVYDVASKRRRVLFSGLRSHIHPEKIVVDPIDGFLFWVDASRRAIVRTDTDGRNLTEIVKMWDVGAIALDIKERRIYWLATHRYHAIASTDYDGKDTRMVLQSCHFVQGFEPSLAVLDDRVFWTTGDALLSVSKNGGERVPRAGVQTASPAP